MELLTIISKIKTTWTIEMSGYDKKSMENILTQCEKMNPNITLALISTDDTKALKKATDLLNAPALSAVIY